MICHTKKKKVLNYSLMWVTIIITYIYNKNIEQNHFFDTVEKLIFDRTIQKKFKKIKRFGTGSET